MLKKSLLTGSVSLLILLGISAPALAQGPQQPNQQQQQNQKQPEVPDPEDISDQELQKFASAVQQMRGIQEDSRKKFSKTIEQQGLSEKRFNEILQGKRNPEKEVDASEKEMQQFEKTTEKLAKIQRDMQSEMQQVLKSEGLEPTKFQKILAAVRQNQELQKQVDQMMNNSQ